VSEEVVQKFRFLTRNKRWSGYVEVAECEKNGRSYVILRLHVGNRSVLLPRRGLEDVVLALTRALGVANARYERIIEKMNRRE